MSEFNKYRLKGAYHYDWYETEDWYKWLVDRCVKFCKGSTVDIGCGEGLLVDLIDKKYEATGLDKDVDAIRLGEEIGNNVILKDVDTDDVLGTWDYLASINSVEHLHKPEVLKQLIRNNVRKGAIITTIDYQGGPLGEDHKFEWTMEEMMEFFKEFNPKPFRYKNTEWIGVEIRK